MSIQKKFRKHLEENDFHCDVICKANVFYTKKLDCYPYFIPFFTKKYNCYFLNVKFCVDIPQFNDFYFSAGGQRVSGFPLTTVIGNTTSSILGLNFVLSDKDDYVLWFQYVRNKLLHLNDVMPKDIVALRYGVSRGEIGESGIKCVVNGSSNFRDEYKSFLEWLDSKI